MKKWRYFWNLEKLYDQTTNTAHCIYTGSQIEMDESSRRKIPCYAFQYSASVVLMLSYIVKLFRDYSKALPLVYVGCTTVIGVFLFLFLRRFNLAYIMTKADWIPVSNSLAGKGYTEEREQKAAAENRFIAQTEMRGLLFGIMVAWLFM